MRYFDRTKGTSWAALVVAALTTVGAGGYFLAATDDLTAQSPAAKAPVNERAVSHANALSEAFRSSADRVLPAVVSIKHTAETRTVKRDVPAPRSRRGQLPPEIEGLDPLLKRFFEDVPGLDGMEGLERVPRMPRMSSGSGVIIDPSGVVLTNNHVVAGGGKIVVKLHDGREYEAIDVKTDPNTDIAVIRIKADGSLPFATLGDSDKMQIGDWVLALGQPFGLENTVTAGIVSAKGRNIGMMNHEEFIQTDAAINPGNSGGPLVNLQGEIVGINTAISSNSGGFQGVGFAVPVNVAKWVSTQLQKDGKVHRAYLGIGIQPVDSALAEQLGMKAPSGALVTEVQPDSPAAAAGVQPQDVIVELNGAAIHNHRQLQAMVARATFGTKMPMVVMRDGKRVTLNVTFREQPANYGERIASSPSESDEPEGKPFYSLGLEVAPLTGDVARQLGLSSEKGVVIVGVEEGSVAEQAGLTTSMAIVQVGRTPVESVEDFEAAMKGVSLEKGVLLLVRSTEGSRFVVLKSE